MQEEKSDIDPNEPSDDPVGVIATTRVRRWASIALALATLSSWFMVYHAAASSAFDDAAAALLAAIAVAVTGVSAATLVELSALVRRLNAQAMEIRELENRDSLSGAFNHAAFLEIAGREFARSRRYGQPLSMLIFDVDFFRRIHDGYGPLVSATAVQSFAKVLQGGLRNVDAVGRLGGEEFAVMLPNTEVVNAETLADRLREDAAAIVIRAQEGEEVRFTTSVGVAQLSSEDVTAEDLIRRAGAALGQAKDLGRNRVSVASG